MKTTTPHPRLRCRSLRGVQIIGTGSYVPDGVLTNQHLQHRFGRAPEWIVKLTGIRERRHALGDQATSDLCYEAAKRCIEQSHVDPRKIDLVLVATVTPDTTFPSTACLVQERLKLNAAAVDLSAACTGFMYALVTGAAYVTSGASDMALIIGGDCMSRVVDPEDVKTYPLFGDGAGAVLLTRGRPDQGLVRYCLGAEGSGADLLCRPAGGSRIPPTCQALAEGKQYLQMNGKGVFQWAASILCDSIQEVLRASELQPGDIDLYIPHQANVRIINAAIDVLRIPRTRVFYNLDRYGNTSAGSVPLALDEAKAEGLIKPGNLIVLSGFGSGLTWGTAVMRW
jgi:3-oxoacyl-[acyl-carrier-protein] synthase III